MLTPMRSGLLRAVAAVLLLGACAPGAEPITTSSIAGSSTTSGVTAATRGTVPPFQEVTVGVESGSLGDYLVDASGRSLYIFALDDERTSTCVNACAERWPPLLGDPTAEAGVDQSLLGNAERPNGAIQVTYAGHPLYYYSGDAVPGDTEGQGFNEVWFLVSPPGEPLTG